MDNIEFSNRITELRKQRGLSQKELGDMLGVSNKAVSKWENGESLPKTATMIKMAELFNLDANELIGFTTSDKENHSFAFDEISKLKSENAVLSSKLQAISRMRKKALIAVVFICIVSVIVSGVIAFCFSSGKNKNLSINDAGEKGTYIVFADKMFVPSTKYQQLLINELEYCNDEKYAEYTNTNGTKQQVLIGCDYDDSYITMKVGRKCYYYVNENSAFPEIVLGNVKELWIESENEGILCEIYEAYDADDKDAIKAFCDFYADKGKPVDKKITELYLDNNSSIAKVVFYYKNEYPSSIFDVNIGKIFKDDKGNVYFYDYVTTNSYSVGKELSKYVI